MPNTLNKTINNLLTPKKGILAADESPNSANKNLAKVNIEGTQENRQRYRDLLINAPDLSKYVSGMILCDETFWQADSHGKPFTQVLQSNDIVVIVKVDESTHEFYNHPNEKITLGIDGLKDRLPNYYENGARAAKWRSIYSISENTPTKALLDANATSLALYALACQEFDIVPIVEPEVLFNGDHSFIEAQDVTSQVLRKVFEKLYDYKVDLSNIILKSSMVLPGKDSEEFVTAEQIGQATVDVFKESVPKEVKGIVFLSGGQEPMQATENLNAIAKVNDTDWQMTYSFLRAISGPALEVWGGKDANVVKAREVLIKKLELDSMAMQGLLEL